jgi:hypothetical protein
LGSVATLAHPLGHMTSPCPQTHWPLMQVPPVPHAWLHMPQLLGSVLRFTQAPLH